MGYYEVSMRTHRDPVGYLGQAIEPSSRVRSMKSTWKKCVPVGRGREEANVLSLDRVGHKFVDGVRDEHVRLLNAAPEIVPDLGLWRALLVNEVAAHLDVRTIENRHLGANFADERDETGHLRIVNEDNICASWGLGND